MTGAAPQVTVVVPTRDRAGLLGRTLRGALGQEGVDHEVVVVDDGSRDGTADVLAAIGDPRLRVVRHRQAEGVSRARNDGIAAAAAPWVAFLDDDDLWAPTKLRAQLDAAGRSGAGWVWSGMLSVDAALNPLLVYRSPQGAGIARRLMTTCEVPAPSTVMARTDLVRRLGGFDESLASTADWDLWIRLARSEAGVGVDEVLVAYVEHGDNMLAGAADPRLARPEFDRLARKHADAADAAGVEFGHLWWNRWVASRHRRSGRRVLAARTYLADAVEHRRPGSLARAAVTLAGDRVWHVVRAWNIGRPVAPDWLTRYRDP
jgi:glycosyltransferase involved in cell wall biosynthesis